MKKSLLLIAASIVILALGGYLIWGHNIHMGQSSADGCKARAGDYNLKMSLVCEHSCAAKDVDESKIRAQSKAKTGDYTQCPVSGVVFMKTTESVKVTYGGKTAYTCCGGCQSIFAGAPEKYVANIY